MGEYRYDSSKERIKELQVEETNWNNYYLTSEEGFTRGQIEAIRERMNKIREEKVHLQEIISGVE
jgi:predicted nuclease with TOPRIM domain